MIDNLRFIKSNKYGGRYVLQFRSSLSSGECPTDWMDVPIHEEPKECDTCEGELSIRVMTGGGSFHDKPCPACKGKK